MKYLSFGLNKVTRPPSYALLVVIFVTANSAAALGAALPKGQKEIYDKEINYYEVATCSDEVSAAVGGNDGRDRSSTGFGLSEIAQSNDIHSIAVRKLGTNQKELHNASDSPNAVASTLKLIIVDAALSAGVGLDEKVKIEGLAYYGTDDAIGKNDTVTVRQAITAALGSGSSNNGANAIIKAAGGPETVQDKVRQLGYKNTAITSYFKETSSSEVKNNSTAEDVTQAMNRLYSGERDGDKVAQAALRQSSSANGGGYNLDSEANKWGLRNNPPVRANSAVFKTGSVKYIITMYTNKPVESNITKATKEVLTKIEASPNALIGEPPEAELANIECCVQNGAAVLDGNSNEEKIWNYLIQQMGLNDVQAAGIMGNIEAESGFSPTALNPSSQAYGIAQWYAGRNTALGVFAQSKGKPKSDLGVQLEFLQKELEGDYKARVLDPIKASNNIAEVTRIWLERFEVPCVPGPACDSYQDTRLPMSTKWHNKFGGSGGGGGSSTGPVSDSSEDACSGLGTGFSPIDFKNKAELVGRILDNKNIVWGNYGPESSQKSDVKDCLNKTTLVALLSMAEQSGAKIPINALARDHGGCTGGSGSLHNSGRAIDIGYFGNGNSRNTGEGNKLYSYLYNNREALKIDELIWQEPPNGQKCVDNLAPVDCYAVYGGVMNDHYHHIHVSFK